MYTERKFLLRRVENVGTAARLSNSFRVYSRKGSRLD